MPTKFVEFHISRLVRVVIKGIDPPPDSSISVFSPSHLLYCDSSLPVLSQFSASLFCLQQNRINMGSITSDENIYLLTRDEAETER